MKKLKHTQGPWGYSRTHENSLNYWYVITHHNGYGPIVDVGGTDLSGQIAEAKHLITDPEEIEANALLISCAPKMLDIIINIYDAQKNPNKSLANLNSEINKIKLMVEEATGMKIEEILN